MSSLEWNKEEIELCEELTEKDRLLIDKIAKKIVYLGLATPAIFFIEMHKPMNFLGSQLLLMLEPILWGFFNTGDFKQFSMILEKRNSLEILLRRIEGFNLELEEKKKRLKEERKEQRKQKRKNKQE